MDGKVQFPRHGEVPIPISFQPSRDPFQRKIAALGSFFLKAIVSSLFFFVWWRHDQRVEIKYKQAGFSFISFSNMIELLFNLVKIARVLTLWNNYNFEIILNMDVKNPRTMMMSDHGLTYPKTASFKFFQVRFWRKLLKIESVLNNFCFHFVTKWKK